MTFEVKHTQKVAPLSAVFSSSLIPIPKTLLTPPTTHAELTLIERRALLTM